MLRDKVRPQQLDLLVNELDRLRTLPPAVQRLLNASVAGAPQREPLAAELAGDASLAAALVELARTQRPGSGADRPDAAAEALGTEAVCRAGVCAKVLSIFGVPAGALDRRDFWLHCLAAAVAADSAARLMGGRVDPFLAFACGLLHDVGKIALSVCLPKSYRRVLAAVTNQAASIAEAERQIIGVDHALLGRRVAQHWKLARRIEETVWLHHHPLGAQGPAADVADLIGLTQFADTIVREQQIGFSGNSSHGPDSARIAAAIGLPEGAASAIAGALREDLQRLTEWVELSLGEPGVASVAEGAATAAPVHGGPTAAQTNASQREAGALKHLVEFAARARGIGDPPRLCAEIARTFAEAFPAPRRDQPTCACCICEQDDHVALSVRGSGGEKALRLSAARAVPPPPADRAIPAAQALGALLESPDAWSDLIDADAYIFLPLTAGERWLGGVLLPAGAAADEELRDVFCDITAFALAAAVDRYAAERLAERLARSSQHLDETRQVLARSEAFTAIGEMAAGAAHEVNNPLAVISGRAQMLARSAGSDRDREMAEAIVAKAQDISNIATELMAFARPPAPVPSAVAVADLLEPMKTPDAPEQEQKAGAPRVDIDIRPGCPPVWVDAGQIQGVLQELVRNASAAEGKSVRVEASEAGPEAVLLRVTDDGAGMDEKVMASAFTPFFSHRPAGRGRGLGLPRARRCVQANAGRIWIDSRPGNGTTVFLELPRASEEVPQK